MSEPGSDRLSKILDGLQARLEGDLKGNRLALTHPGARGQASEDDWLFVLKSHLPQRYQADSAFVIDCYGDTSEQVDIVIYDRQYSPFLYNQTNQRYVPAESVYAVLEVKQDLSRDHIQYAGKKAASVRRLHRTSARIPHAGGEYEPRQLPAIVSGLVAYESSWNPPLGQPLREALCELPALEKLDIGCSLLRGTFETAYKVGQPDQITIVESRHSLVQFLFRLLKLLQAMGTAPAIDYSSYLTRFERLESDS